MTPQLICGVFFQNKSKECLGFNAKVQEKYFSECQNQILGQPGSRHCAGAIAVLITNLLRLNPGRVQ